MRRSRSLILWLSLSACTVGSGSDDVVADGEHCGDIVSDERWAAGIHTITCDVQIDGGHVEIEAGATLRFAADASIQVGCQGTGLGSLAAEGGEDAPITMVSSSGLSGHWNYVRFCDGADPTRNALRHTTISGTGAYDNTTTPAGLVMDGTEVLVEHVTIEDSTGYGFSLRNGARFAAGSTALRTVGNARTGWTTAASQGSVPGDGSYTGNDEDSIELYGGRVEMDDTWERLDVPVVFEGDVVIAGTDTLPAVLVLEPGTTLLFNGRGMSVGDNGQAGGLVAVGTEAAPIVLSAPGAPDPGAWEGIEITSDAVDAETIFEHTEIRYAKYGAKIRDASPAFDNVVFADSLYCGLYLLGESAPDVGNIRFEGNAPGYCE
ncbi:MAG: hypothetical protein AAFV53_24085 [Myxococcota bacterium]